VGDLDKKASALADLQHGVIGTRQLGGLGGEQHHADTRTAGGRWVSDLRGVYRVIGSSSTWRQHLSAAVLAGGVGTAVSHRSALELHGVMSFDQMVEVATPRPRRFRTSGDVTIHTSMVLPDDDITSVDGIPVANIERALLDAGAVVFEGKLRYCVDAALRLGLTDVDRLSSLLAARRKRGRRGVRPLERALVSLPVGGLPESPYERYALEIVRDFGLPEPVLQYEVLLPSGRTIRIDLAWPKWWLGAEIDGHGYHATRSERAYDADRNNELTLIGWNLLRFTTDQIYRAPDQVGHTIWRALQAAEARSCDA